ncbi:MULTISPECIES: YfbM family protein [unclassified Massilia]|uniref:YfbM family protein n=1 Tax=unclassified Massilia TaxID=2609279 RepID=UPI001782A558|nr:MULTISPECIES: YfbM family protein [unclassified Massilia]MBD8528899.1 YfbM family protein [Massilia sp. CFBP 13647]MBD8673541.1 YfbM family protein [Massilia sp. CFBP 13721]
MGIIVCFTALPPQELARLRAHPDDVDQYLYPKDGDGEPPNYFSLDKEWHGIHYLLTGEAEGGPLPLALSIMGGEEFGPELSFGPARFLTPDEVAAVALALIGVTPAVLAERYDPQDMEAKEIYPEIWVRDDTEALRYLLQSFTQLQKFYTDAAARGDAVIQWHN